jgi:hypothetical protein
MKKSRLVIIIYLLCIAFENSYADTFPDAIHARLKNNIVEDFSSLMQGTILDEMILSVKQKHPEKSYARGLYAQKLSRWYKIQLKPGKNLIDAQRLLLKTGYFDVVEAIPLVKTCFNPNDPSTAQQYHLGLMKMFEGWDIFQGDTNTVIGITDTGFEFTHEDLAGSVKINYNDMPDGIDNDNDGYIDNFRGWDCSMNDNNPSSDPCATCYHGVHVAGIAGAVTNNALGIAGTGFHCKLLPIKIADSFGVLTSAYEGIIYAADHGCKIINCSWGSMSGGEYGQDVVSYATYEKQSLVIASAGNNGLLRDFYPASYREVLSVAASNQTDTRWTLSNFGTRVDVCAPGENIYSTWNGNVYTASSGTSMSAPAVSGCAGIVASYFPQEGPLQWAARIKNGCDNIDTIPGNASAAGFLGRGRVNLFRALQPNPGPSIRLLSEQFSDNADNVFEEGDTLQLLSTFVNDLDSSVGLNIVLRSMSGFVEILDSVFNAGSPGNMDTCSNQNQLFRFRILPGAPVNHEALLKYVITDTNGYLDREYAKVIVNVDYINVQVNSLGISVASKGLFGYNSFSQPLGIGVTLNGSPSLLYEGGLMVGNSGGQVMNRIRSSAGTADADWNALQTVSRTEPSVVSDFDVKGVFDDSGAGTGLLGLSVRQQAYAWSDPANNGYVVLEYTLRNHSNNTYDSLYAGLFADWDIMNYALNSVQTDNSRKMGYAFSNESGGLYAGIKLLSSQDFHHYAIDLVSGGSGGVNLGDGFSEQEKLFVLSNNRASSGNTGSGNDIGHVVSGGPFMLAPQDSISIAFSILAGNNPTALQIAADASQIQYNGLITPSIAEKKHLQRIYPNPANDRLFLPKTCKGYRIHTLDGGNLMSGNEEHPVDISQLKPGAYLIGLYNGISWDYQCFIKIKQDF